MSVAGNPVAPQSESSLRGNFALCFWWEYKGILHYELLAGNQVISSGKSSLQLENLKAATERKMYRSCQQERCCSPSRDSNSTSFIENRTKIGAVWPENVAPLLHPIFTRHCPPPAYKCTFMYSLPWNQHNFGSILGYFQIKKNNEDAFV